jgi:hypothetical protein
MQYIKTSFIIFWRQRFESLDIFQAVVANSRQTPLTLPTPDQPPMYSFKHAPHLIGRERGDVKLKRKEWILRATFIDRLHSTWASELIPINLIKIFPASGEPGVRSLLIVAQLIKKSLGAHISIQPLFSSSGNSQIWWNLRLQSSVVSCSAAPEIHSVGCGCLERQPSSQFL